MMGRRLLEEAQAKAKTTSRKSRALAVLKLETCIIVLLWGTAWEVLGLGTLGSYLSKSALRKTCGLSALATRARS